MKSIFALYSDTQLCTQAHLCLVAKKIIGPYKLGLTPRILKFHFLVSPILILFDGKGLTFRQESLTFGPFNGTVHGWWTSRILHFLSRYLLTLYKMKLVDGVTFYTAQEACLDGITYHI